jgi:hypothetical protein
MPSEVAMISAVRDKTRSGLKVNSTSMFQPAAAVSRMRALRRPLLETGWSSH